MTKANETKKCICGCGDSMISVVAECGAKFDAPERTFAPDGATVYCPFCDVHELFLVSRAD